MSAVATETVGYAALLRERCVDRADVRYLSPHTTRHTYDLEERQLLMGHESVRTTQRYYGHLTVEDVAAKMRALT